MPLLETRPLEKRPTQSITRSSISLAMGSAELRERRATISISSSCISSTLSPALAHLLHQAHLRHQAQARLARHSVSEGVNPQFPHLGQAPQSRQAQHELWAPSAATGGELDISVALTATVLHKNKTNFKALDRPNRLLIVLH